MSQLSPSAKPPVLAVDPFPRVRLLIYTIVLIAVAGFAHAEDNAALFLGGLAAAVVAWLLVDHGKGRPLPAIVVNVIVLGVTANFFYQVRFGDPEDALFNLGHFMIYILLAKLFERKQPRDITQVLALALLVLVTAAIFATSAMFASLVALFSVCALYTLILFHVRTETQRALRERLLPSKSPVSHGGRARVYRDVRRVTFICGGFLLFVALAVFVVAPRTSGQPFLSSWSPAATFESGYTNEVRLYQSGELALSEAVVMEVRLEQDGTNIGSEVYQPYFRGQSFDSYNPMRHQWIRSQSLIDDRRTSHRESDGAFHLGRPPAGDAPEITQTYSIEIFRDNVLFTLDDPLSLQSGQLLGVSYCDDDFSLMGQFNNRLPLQYVVSSAAVPRSPAQAPPDAIGDYGGQPRPPQEGKQEKLDKPFVEPGVLGSYRRNFNATSHARVPDEIMNLAHTVAKDLLPADGQPIPLTSVRPIADRFQTYLQNNYPYSLSMEAVNKDMDPTADFLLNRKVAGGHCEMFASAMVMMCRAVGINARVVTGFHGGDFNSLGGFYIVRALHAHAWTEVYLPNSGWTRYDPSPASNDRAAGVDSYTRWIQELTQVLQQSWISNIISFDSRTQASVFAAIGAFFTWLAASVQELLTTFVGSLRDVFSWRSGLPWASRLLRLAVLGVVVWALGALVRGYWRRRTSPLLASGAVRHLGRRAKRRLSQELGFFDEFLRMLRRRGAARRPGETPREYVEGLRPVLKNAFGDAQFLVGTFYDIRFGRLALTPELRQRVTAALQNVRVSLQTRG